MTIVTVSNSDYQRFAHGLCSGMSLQTRFCGIWMSILLKTFRFCDWTVSPLMTKSHWQALHMAGIKSFGHNSVKFSRTLTSQIRKNAFENTNRCMYAKRTPVECFFSQSCQSRKGKEWFVQSSYKVICRVIGNLSVTDMTERKNIQLAFSHQSCSGMS